MCNMIHICLLSLHHIFLTTGTQVVFLSCLSGITLRQTLERRCFFQTKIPLPLAIDPEVGFQDYRVILFLRFSGIYKVFSITAILIYISINTVQAEISFLNKASPLQGHEETDRNEVKVSTVCNCEILKNNQNVFQQQNG